MNIDENEIKEMTHYLRSLCVSSGVLFKSIDDIIQSTLMELLPNWEEYSQKGQLYYWAKIKLTEARSKHIASDSVLSGISGMAHHAAKKYLAAANGDVDRAYANQFTTVKVSRQLLQSLTSVYAGELIDGEAFSVLEEHDREEPAIHKFKDAFRELILFELTDREAKVAWLYLGYDDAPLTFAQIAEELGVSQATVQRAWASALAKLEPRVRDIVSSTTG